MSEPLVDLVVEETGWNAALPDLAKTADAAAALALGAVGVDPDHYALALLACDDERISVLNQTFRARPGPTNVLSWPAFTLAPATAGGRPAKPPGRAGAGRRHLGDVAIALQTCLREADSAALPLKNHVTHLIVHGCLHLLGYGHETDEDAKIMEGIEGRALMSAGLANPYE